MKFTKAELRKALAAKVVQFPPEFNTVGGKRGCTAVSDVTASNPDGEATEPSPKKRVKRAKKLAPGVTSSAQTVSEGEVATPLAPWEMSPYVQPLKTRLPLYRTKCPKTRLFRARRVVLQLLPSTRQILNLKVGCLPTRCHLRHSPPVRFVKPLLLLTTKAPEGVMSCLW